MKSRTVLGATILMIVSPLALSADVVVLKNGRELSGTFLGGDSRIIRFLDEAGRLQNISISQLDRVVFTGEGKPSGLSSYPSEEVNPATDRPLFRQSMEAEALDTIPAGTVLVVRMIDSVSSDEDEPGDIFEATLEKPVVREGVMLAPKGTPVEVQLVHVRQSGQWRGEEEIALLLRRMTLDEETYLMDTSFAEVASEAKGGQTAKVVGATAAIGAIIGAIAGGKKGAAVGAATGAGAGATVQVLRGKEVRVPSETRLSFILQEAITLD